MSMKLAGSTVAAKSPEKQPRFCSRSLIKKKKGLEDDTID